MQQGTDQFAGSQFIGAQMREIAEIELAIQGGTEKIEQLGGFRRKVDRCVSGILTIRDPVGEQGQVDESLREMAAIEALKSEKADKEVSLECP